MYTVYMCTYSSKFSSCAQSGMDMCKSVNNDVSMNLPIWKLCYDHNVSHLYLFQLNLTVV